MWDGLKRVGQTLSVSFSLSPARPQPTLGLPETLILQGPLRRGRGQGQRSSQAMGPVGALPGGGLPASGITVSIPSASRGAPSWPSQGRGQQALQQETVDNREENGSLMRPSDRTWGPQT